MRDLCSLLPCADKVVPLWAFLLSPSLQEATLGPFGGHSRTKQQVVLPLILTGIPVLSTSFVSPSLPCIVLKGSSTQK